MCCAMWVCRSEGLKSPTHVAEGVLIGAGDDDDIMEPIECEQTENGRLPSMASVLSVTHSPKFLQKGREIKASHRHTDATLF